MGDVFSLGIREWYDCDYKGHCGAVTLPAGGTARTEVTIPTLVAISLSMLMNGNYSGKKSIESFPHGTKI